MVEDWWLSCGMGALLMALLGWWLWREGTRGMPGPWGLPIVGYLPFLNPGQLHLELTNLARRYGPVYRLRLGQKRVVVLADRSVIKEALALPELAGRPDSGLTALLASGGHSCLNFRSADDPVWQRNRRVAAHAADLLLSSKRSRIEEDVSRGLLMLSRQVGCQKQPIQVQNWLQPVVESLMSGLCLGRPVALGDPLLKSMSADFDAILDQQARMELLAFLPTLHWFYQKDVDQCTQRIRSLAARVRPNITRKLPGLPKQVADLSEAVAEAEASEKACADDMVQLDFFDAASHTVSENLQWLLLLMATHPQVQERVHKVLDIGVPSDRMASLADRPYLVYLDAVVLESLRFASNLPFAIPHAASATVESFHGYRIPAGSLVLANLYAVNRDPLAFPQPDGFLPERFLLKSGGLNKDLAAAALPFSSGLRACVGEKIARHYLFLLFANILRNWRLTLPPSEAAKGRRQLLRPVASFSLFPQPFRLFLTPRSRYPTAFRSL